MKVYKLSIASLALVTACAGALAYKEETIPSLEAPVVSYDYSIQALDSYLPISFVIPEIQETVSTYVYEDHSYIEVEQFSVIHDVLTRDYVFNEKSDDVLQLQIYLDIHKDGHYGLQTRSAHIDALNKVGLSALSAPSVPQTVSLSKQSSVSKLNPDQACLDFHDLALSLGWPESDIPRLSYIMWRESRCNPEAFNKKDPNGGSRGLTQINGYWCRKTSYNPHSAGYLGALGIISSCEDLFDPKLNLTAAKAIYDYGVERRKCPWGPWTTKKTSWCR